MDTLYSELDTHENFCESTLVGFPPTMPPGLKKIITRFKLVKFLRNFWGALFRRNLSKISNFYLLVVTNKFLRQFSIKQT